MASNDFYTTYKCKICGSKVEEIPLEDQWKMHVMSAFKCTNTKCGMYVSETQIDIDIYDYVEEKYHEK